MKYHPVNFSAKNKMRLILIVVTAVAAFALIEAIPISFAYRILLFSSLLISAVSAYFAYPGFRKDPLKTARAVFDPQVEEKLLALEEIGEFFGSSLKPADMFRLVGNRIAEILPFEGCFLFLANDSGDILRIAHSVCEDPPRFNGLIFNSREGLAGKAFTESRALSDAQFSFEDKLFPRHFKQSIAAPVSYQGGKMGALALCRAGETAYDESSLLLLQAVCERISLLINSSFNNQRNAASAFTDLLTDLPNEAAFYLILEQQLAEAQRIPEKRALTILCMDIKDFSSVNQEYGHSAGDQLLNFTSRIIKNQLRQMDFLAHPSADEFWAILPGASEEIVELVIERLDRAFSQSLFTLPPNIKIDIELHFGTATFRKDGEIAQDLVRSALKRKSREKSFADPVINSVIPFPLRNTQITGNPF
jgi:diguanylate cyclase (GGDEF)-like protein